MKILGLDLGDARTGLSVCDPTGMLAGSPSVIHEWNREKLLETGMATVLVLSGMTSEHDIRKYAFRPDVVLQGVGSIPPVTED